MPTNKGAFVHDEQCFDPQGIMPGGTQLSLIRVDNMQSPKNVKAEDLSRSKALFDKAGNFIIPLAVGFIVLFVSIILMNMADLGVIKATTDEMKKDVKTVTSNIETIQKQNNAQDLRMERNFNELRRSTDAHYSGLSSTLLIFITEQQTRRKIAENIDEILDKKLEEKLGDQNSHPKEE